MTMSVLLGTKYLLWTLCSIIKPIVWICKTHKRPLKHWTWEIFWHNLPIWQPLTLFCLFIQQPHAFSPCCEPETVLSLGYSYENICFLELKINWGEQKYTCKCCKEKHGLLWKGGGGQTWSEGSERLLRRSDMSAVKAWRMRRNWLGDCLFALRCPVPSFSWLQRTPLFCCLSLAFFCQEILQFPWFLQVHTPKWKSKSLVHVVLRPL